MHKYMILLLVCSLGLIGSTPGVSISPGWSGLAIDPPVILSNSSDKVIFLKWQTSIPGVAASPVSEHSLKPNEQHTYLKHANFWITEVGTVGTDRSVPNTIEVWVHSADSPAVILAYYKTVRLLYPENLKQEDKKVTLEINVPTHMGVEVKLEMFG